MRSCGGAGAGVWLVERGTANGPLRGIKPNPMRRTQQSKSLTSLMPQIPAHEDKAELIQETPAARQMAMQMAITVTERTPPRGSPPSPPPPPPPPPPVSWVVGRASWVCLRESTTLDTRGSTLDTRGSTLTHSWVDTHLIPRPQSQSGVRACVRASPSSRARDGYRIVIVVYAHA